MKNQWLGTNQLATYKLSDLHGRRLSFAPQATLRPDPTHLAWHRCEVFGSL